LASIFGTRKPVFIARAMAVFMASR